MTAKTKIKTKTITLDMPIQVEGREITQVTLRRPKVGDIRRMDKQGGSDLEKTLWLLSTLGELTPEEVDELDGGDLEKLADVVGDFTGEGTAAKPKA